MALAVKRGRPKNADTVNRELKDHIVYLEKQIREKEKPYEEMRQLADILRLVNRALKGLDEKDDNFLGLIDVGNITERTRLNETALLGHSAMHTIARIFPEDFGFYQEIADYEDHYYVSEDGLGRQEAVGMIAAKTRLDAQNQINIGNQQQAENLPGPQQPKKKGFFQKLTRR